MLVPEDVKDVEVRLGASKKQVFELRFAVAVETDDFPVEHAPAPSQVTSEAVAQAGEGLEHIAVSGYESDAIFVGMQNRPDSVPLDFKQPIGMAKWVAYAAKWHWLKCRGQHCC